MKIERRVELQEYRNFTREARIGCLLIGKDSNFHAEYQEFESGCIFPVFQQRWGVFLRKMLCVGFLVKRNHSTHNTQHPTSNIHWNEFRAYSTDVFFGTGCFHKASPWAVEFRPFRAIK